MSNRNYSCFTQLTRHYWRSRKKKGVELPTFFFIYGVLICESGHKWRVYPISLINVRRICLSTSDINHCSFRDSFFGKLRIIMNRNYSAQILMIGHHSSIDQDKCLSHKLVKCTRRDSSGIGSVLFQNYRKKEHFPSAFNP